ncbi:MAG: CRTAC1 family protein, partial [Bacteroidia bacterium]|nr:CRTAC1 family protein [Bacteroidia bacterium]
GDGQFTAVLDGPVVNTFTFDNGGNCFGDYDNDGDLDLFVSSMFGNFLYDNNGDGTFTRNTTETVILDYGRESYGAAWADYDNDGDLDLIVPNAYGGPSDYFYISLFANNGNGNHWFKVTCKGVITNRDAIGARVYIKAHINGQDIWQLREINGNSAYGGGGGGAVSGLVCHFGLGDATVIDTLKVVWPTSGITQMFTGVGIDQYVKIFEDDNTFLPVEACVSDLPPKNPGIIKGVVFNDTNNDCDFDPATDYYLPNRLIKAAIGDYYVITDYNGEYELRVLGGNYEINQVQLENEILTVSNCPETEVSYNIDITPNQIVHGFDFVDILEKLSCGVLIVDVSTEPNPYPGETTQLCYSIVNNGPAITEFNVSVTAVPNFITQISTDCSSNLPANGGFCSFCFDVTVPVDFPIGNLIFFTICASGNCLGDTFDYCILKLYQEILLLSGLIV